MNQVDEVDEVAPEEMDLVRPDDLWPEVFPEMINISAAFLFQFVPDPSRALTPEVAYVPIDIGKACAESPTFRNQLTISQWNMLWEAGHLRSETVPKIMGESFPAALKWLTEIRETNLYLIPDGRLSRFDAFGPLYHLLPSRTLERYGLPKLKRRVWPTLLTYPNTLDRHFTEDFDQLVSKAFASHVWPLLNSGSRIQAFSKDDPIVLLAHNLNFWLPSIYKVAEDRIRKFQRAEFDSQKQLEELKRLRTEFPDNVSAERPLCGGSIWCGEEDAWEATRELVEVADKHGQLRQIIDAVNSGRVADDFSDRWSHAKEDFERKLYHKRAKVRVSFVQLDEATAVHAPTSELHENLIWEDLFAVVNVKERQIVVCLKNGLTRATEISKRLGYANHSPISKALKRIRQKVKKYLDQ